MDTPLATALQKLATATDSAGAGQIGQAWDCETCGLNKRARLFVFNAIKGKYWRSLSAEETATLRDTGPTVCGAANPAVRAAARQATATAMAAVENIVSPAKENPEP